MTFAADKSGEEYVKGVWVSTVENLDFPSKPGLTAAEMKSELDDIVTTCSQMGINAIFFQVRPCADALYKSDIFPWSAVLTGTQGKAPDGDFDPLSYLIQKAHASQIQVHAIHQETLIGSVHEIHPPPVIPAYAPILLIAGSTIVRGRMIPAKSERHIVNRTDIKMPMPGFQCRNLHVMLHFCPGRLAHACNLLRRKKPVGLLRPVFFDNHRRTIPRHGKHKGEQACKHPTFQSTSLFHLLQ